MVRIDFVPSCRDVFEYEIRINFHRSLRNDVPRDYIQRTGGVARREEETKSAIGSATGGSIAGHLQILCRARSVTRNLERAVSRADRRGGEGHWDIEKSIGFH